MHSAERIQSSRVIYSEILRASHLLGEKCMDCMADFAAFWGTHIFSLHWDDTDNIEVYQGKTARVEYMKSV